MRIKRRRAAVVIILASAGALGFTGCPSPRAPARSIEARDATQHEIAQQPHEAPPSDARDARSLDDVRFSDASPPPSAPPRQELCDVLSRRWRAALTAERTRAQRTLRRLVEQDRDPLASQRRALIDELASARASDASSVADLQRRLDDLRAEHVRQQFVDPDDSGGFHPTDPELTDEQRCAPYATGAWGILLESAARYPSNADDWTRDWRAMLHLVVAHVDERGRVATAPIETNPTPGTQPDTNEPWIRRGERYNFCEYPNDRLGAPSLFDYDQDGSPEYFVSSQFSHEGAHFEWSALYTFRDGRIRRYPTPAGFSIIRLEDVNADGRPDLIDSRVIDVGMNCGSGFSRLESTPEFAAISRPDGTFDTQGVEAQAFARRSCSEPVASPEQVDSFQSVLCARLWGVSVPALQAAIERRFAPWSCEDEEAGRRQRSRRAHRDFDAMRAALTVNLPLTLAPAPNRG
jgi:hypothetical protein